MKMMVAIVVGVMSAFPAHSITKSQLVLSPAIAPQASRSADINPYPGFVELPITDVEARNYNEARKRSIQYIRTAISKLNNSNATYLGEKVIEELRRARFFVSSTEESTKKCGDRGFFVNGKYPGIIFICDGIREVIRDDFDRAIDKTAQLFIHEGVHLAGVSNECVATEFELIVIDESIGVQTWVSKDRYQSQCKEL